MSSPSDTPTAPPTLQTALSLRPDAHLMLAYVCGLEYAQVIIPTWQGIRSHTRATPMLRVVSPDEMAEISEAGYHTYEGGTHD
ncbi:MAG TPA: hypothetical protein VM554_00020 [Acidisarcina sp.]|nr:hypothetical protein [Acidisarcina sp.]